MGNWRPEKSNTFMKFHSKSLWWCKNRNIFLFLIYFYFYYFLLKAQVELKDGNYKHLLKCLTEKLGMIFGRIAHQIYLPFRWVVISMSLDDGNWALLEHAIGLLLLWPCSIFTFYIVPKTRHTTWEFSLMCSWNDSLLTH